VHYQSVAGKNDSVAPASQVIPVSDTPAQRGGRSAKYSDHNFRRQLTEHGGNFMHIVCDYVLNGEVCGHSISPDL